MSDIPIRVVGEETGPSQKKDSKKDSKKSSKKDDNSSKSGSAEKKQPSPGQKRAVSDDDDDLLALLMENKPGSSKQVQIENVSKKQFMDDGYLKGREDAQAETAAEFKKINSLLALLVSQQKQQPSEAVSDKLPGTKKKTLVLPNLDSPDEDNLDEEFMDPSDEDEESDDQSDVEKDDLDNFGKDVSDLKKRQKPSEHAANYWYAGRKVGSSYAKEDWRTRSGQNKVKQLTTAPEARMFRSPEVDPELPDLPYKDKKDLQKQLSTLADYGGAVGHMASAALANLRDKRVQIAATIDEYKQPDIRIEDPATEIIALLSNIKEDMVEGMAKMLIDMIRILGSQFNQVLVMRRSMFLFQVTQKKNARGIIKKLNPTDELLFGGKIGEVQKNLHYAQSINPLSVRQGKQNFKPNYNKGFKKNFKKGSKPFNSRVARFAKKKKDD